MPEKLFFLIPFCQRSLQKLLNADHKSNFCRLLLVKCFWFAQHHLATTIINRKDSSSISRTLYNSKVWKTAYWRYRGFKLQLMCALASPLHYGERVTSLTEVLERQLIKCIQSIRVAAMNIWICKESIYPILRTHLNNEKKERLAAFILTTEIKHNIKQYLLHWTSQVSNDAMWQRKRKKNRAM